MAQSFNIFSSRQFLDANGNPYAGAKLFTYLAGTSTKTTVTKDYAGASNHANPIILNSRGEPADGTGVAYPIWQTNNQAIKLVLAPSTDSDPPVSAIAEWDNLYGIVTTDVITTAGDMIYASAARTPARLAVGSSTQVLHGGSSPAFSALVTADMPAGSVVQVVNTITGAVATGTTTIPNDDTIPQNTEGDQYMTLAITPTSATNKLIIDVVVQCAVSSGAIKTVALFQDSTANALAADREENATASAMESVGFTHYMTAGTTSATTFKVRAGGVSGTFTFNGSAGARKLGGVLASSITITEVKA